MDVNSVMSTYNMCSLWNNLNPDNTTGSSSVPLLNSIDSSIKESYEQASYFGESLNSQLQDVYEHVEPDYGIPLTYNSNGNLSIPSDAGSPNILSLLESGETSSDVTETDILSQYDAVENGTYYNIYSNLEVNK